RDCEVGRCCGSGGFVYWRRSQLSFRRSNRAEQRNKEGSKKAYEQTTAGHYYRRWIRWVIRSPGSEIRACRCDTDRPAQLSPVSTPAVSSCHRFAFTGRDRRSTARCLEPSEKCSCFAGRRQGH